MINNKIGFLIVGIFIILDGILILSQGGYYYRGIWKEPSNTEAIIDLIIGSICVYYGLSKNKRIKK